MDSKEPQQSLQSTLEENAESPSVAERSQRIRQELTTNPSAVETLITNLSTDGFNGILDRMSKDSLAKHEKQQSVITNEEATLYQRKVNLNLERQKLKYLEFTTTQAQYPDVVPAQAKAVEQAQKVCGLLEERLAIYKQQLSIEKSIDKNRQEDFLLLREIKLDGQTEGREEPNEEEKAKLEKLRKRSGIARNLKETLEQQIKAVDARLALVLLAQM